MTRAKCTALTAAALFLATTFTAPAAQASFYSGEQIYSLCTAERGSRDYVENTYECVAYITGAVDAFNTAREADKLARCIPPDVTISRLRVVTVEYLRDNQDALSGSASKLVFDAVRKAWPCEKPKPAKPVRKARRKR